MHYSFPYKNRFYTESYNSALEITMNYGELIARALNGRSVNSMAKAWGVHQPTLDRYVKGKAMPDYDLALKIVKEAGVSVSEGFEVLADEERNRKARNFKLQGGFVQIHILALLATCGLYGILYIMSNEDSSKTLYFVVFVPTLRSHPAAYVH